MPWPCRPAFPRTAADHRQNGESKAMNDHPVFDRIKSEIADTPVVLFMKGTPGLSAMRLFVCLRPGAQQSRHSLQGHQRP